MDLPALPRSVDPPPELKPQIAATLRRHGLLRRRGRFSYVLAAAAAIVIAIVIWRRPAPPPEPGYILFLYESPQFTGGSREEYGRWARQMSPRVAGGEELGARDVLAVAGSSTPLPANASRLAGYFLIDAPDDARATEVARACPHLKHGGAVVLRKIVR
jgi:hypothetical protein